MARAGSPRLRSPMSSVGPESVAPRAFSAMMRFVKVFEWSVPNEYESFLPSQESDWDVLSALRGQPVLSRWAPLSVRRHNSGRQKPGADFVALPLANVTIVSARAAELLGDLLRPNGELLALAGDGEGFFAYNCTRIADVLDGTTATLGFRMSSGYYDHIPKYAFLPSASQETVFRIPEVTRVFVTNGFVDRVRPLGLKGQPFEQVWEG